ncbi:DUF6415 family natural product biosynthesis protein [Streptomyces lydicus]|uniref:DUF6415 family natural product biosynthesis protein n=1 Tax=Streptomyces lydicus TaxID=47763 RepID=UPI003F4CE5BF
MRQVQAVIAWGGHATLPPHDYDQIALQLTGHAWAVVAEVRRCCTPLPPHAEPRVLAEVVLEEADRPWRSPAWALSDVHRCTPGRYAPSTNGCPGCKPPSRLPLPLDRLQLPPPRGSGGRSPGTPYRGAPGLLHSAAQYSSHAVMLRGSQTRAVWAHGPGGELRDGNTGRRSSIRAGRPLSRGPAQRSAGAGPVRLRRPGAGRARPNPHGAPRRRAGGPDPDESAVRTAADLLRSPGRAPPAASWSCPRCG